MEGTVELINQCTTDLSQGSMAMLPNLAALRKIVRIKRSEVHGLLTNSINLGQLQFTEACKTYNPQPGISENFLLANSGEDSSRILIFGREIWLHHLRDSQTWYADGTFKIAPPLFSQVYIVSVEKYNGVLPIFYALLSNKQRATYFQMFEIVKGLIPNLKPQLQP